MKLAYFVSHPIQYQAPLLRRIAQEPDFELTVFYSSDFSVRGYADQGFGGVNVRWDVPLLGGHAHEFLPGLRHAAEMIAGFSFEQDVAGLGRTLAFAVPGFVA